MAFFKAVIVEKTAKDFGKTIANTKSPSRFKNMSKQDFAETVKHISCYRIEIIEFNKDND